MGKVKDHFIANELVRTTTIAVDSSIDRETYENLFFKILSKLLISPTFMRAKSNSADHCIQMAAELTEKSLEHLKLFKTDHYNGQ